MMLEEGVRDHRHERVTMQTLLANPSCLDGDRQVAQVGLRRQVGEIVFLLSRHPVFADEPSLLPGQMLLTLLSLIRCGGPSATRTRTAAKRAAHPITGIPRTQPKRTSAAMARSMSIRANSDLVRAVRYSAGIPARFNRAGSLASVMR